LTTDSEGLARFIEFTAGKKTLYNSYDEGNPKIIMAITAKSNQKER
jgi:hypothetical protein